MTSTTVDLDALPTYGGDEGAPSGRLLARVKKVAALLEIMEANPQIRRGICFVREENVEKAIRLCNGVAPMAHELSVG